MTDADAMALDLQGRIVVAGSGSGVYQDFFLARFQTSGDIDASFGSGGTIVTPFTNEKRDSEMVADMILEPEGGIIATGTLEPFGDGRYALARYHGRPIGTVGRTPSKQRYRDVRRSGLRIATRCYEPCRVSTAVVLPRQLARQLGIGPILAHRQTESDRAGRMTLVVRIPGSALTKLASRRQTPIRLVVRFSADGRSREEFRRRLTLVR